MKNWLCGTKGKHRIQACKTFRCFRSSTDGTSSRECRWRYHFTAISRWLLTKGTPSNSYRQESTTQRWRLHQWTRRFNRHLEYTKRLIILSHSCIRKAGYGHVLGPVEATTKQLENQLNQGCMAEAMQQLDETQRGINPFTELY
jgi:hypothetical protein